jgi:hypothetical protein
MAITQADRAAERRREKLEQINKQLKDGSLTIREMTADERRRFPAQAAKPSKSVKGSRPAKAPRR